MKFFLTVKFQGRNEHGSLINWMMIGAPLAGLLKRSENLVFGRTSWAMSPFLFSGAVGDSGSSMFSDSRERFSEST